MPRKQKKSKEEKIAENYFPVDETDLKRTVEKENKPLLSETIIESGPIKKPDYKKPTYKKTRGQGNRTRSKGRVGGTPAKKRSSRKKTPQKFTLPKISLKKDGYELIITEKPQAAGKIASALGDATKRDLGGAPY